MYSWREFFKDAEYGGSMLTNGHTESARPSNIALTPKNMMSSNHGTGTQPDALDLIGYYLKTNYGDQNRYKRPFVREPRYVPGSALAGGKFIKAVSNLKREPLHIPGGTLAGGKGLKSVSDLHREPRRIPQLSESEEEYKDRSFVSDPYFHNILVGGALAGGEGLKGISDLPFGVLSKGPNRELFRNGEIRKIEAAIKSSLERGEHPRVIGHSWGASDIAKMAKDFPGVPFIAADPVSWTGALDEYPNNLTVLFPKKGKSEDNLFSKLAPILGHRWPVPKKGRVIMYDGGHVSGVGEALTGLNLAEWKARDKESFSKYYDDEYNRTPETIDEVIGKYR